MSERRTTRRARRAAGPLAALALAVVAACTSACGGIPSSGPVHAGASLDGPPPVRVLAAPPRAGSTAADIVRGFLRAQPGLDDDEAVARAFLAGPAAQTWATRAKVVVYPDESTLHIVAGPEGAFTVTTPITATVDVNGIYTAALPGAKATLRLKLTQVFGQWRISSLDDAQSLWLTSYDLDRVYAQVPLYYVAPGSRVLVPDLRWFGQTSGLATVIARAQLAPPPAYLRAAVSTGIPSQTRLLFDSVPSTGTVASIDLNSFARQPSSTDRSMLWAQLAASVTQAPGVDVVKVLVNGKVLELPGLSVGAGTTAQALGYTAIVPVTAGAVALSIKDGRSLLTQVGTSDEGQRVPAQGALPTLNLRLRSIARATDAREMAGVTVAGDSMVRVVNGKTSVVLHSAPNLTRPSYDSHRWLWTASSGPGVATRLHAALTGPGVGAKDVTLATPVATWLAGREVTALRISRDGTRALVTSVRGGSTWIDIAGIVRDTHGRPLSLSAPLRVGLGLGDAVDAAWVNASTVAVLARATTDKHIEPYLVTIGAETTPLPTVSDAVGIAAGDGDSAIDIVTSKGQVLAPGGPTGWIPVASGLDVAFPG